MVKTDVGGVIYNQGAAVATLDTTPLADRALLVRRINITNESANDDWRIIVGGREILRARVLTVGAQRMFHLGNSALPTRLDFFEFCRQVLGLDASIPVPNGLTVTVQSVGGATADIDVEAKEVDIGDAVSWPTNHFAKNQFIMPLFWRLAAGQAAPGVFTLDTQTAPPFVPPIFAGANLPVNWKIELLALFIEGAGVNTFSGAANHQSSTQDLHVTRNGSALFTRIGHGIPARGTDSAAGSANTALGTRSGIFLPFEQQLPTDDPVMPVPIVLGGGDTLLFAWDIIGDLTGTASYANALVASVARVTVPSGAGAL